MNKKYKLTKNKKEWMGKTLYQIEAIISFGSIVKGELGGYIEKEDNLSTEGDAWVYGDARVSGKFSLTLGYFFGMRYKKEEIKYYKLDEDTELIYKGEAKIEPNNTDENEIAAIKLLQEKGYKVEKGTV